MNTRRLSLITRQKLIRYRSTTVRLNASRGSEQYHSTNSVIAWSYVRWPLFEVSVLRTADLACSRSGKARTRFGVFLFFREFDMDDGLLAVAFYDAVKSAQAVFVEVIET
jgi:hypothetical protein